MGGAPRKEANANATAWVGPQLADDSKEVCIVHFQGNTKTLIMPFEAFMEGEGASDDEGFILT